MPLYYVPELMDGYQITQRVEGGKRVYYLQQQLPDGLWWDVKGPYKQSHTAKEWLKRMRFRDVLEAHNRGDSILWPEKKL